MFLVFLLLKNLFIYIAEININNVKKEFKGEELNLFNTASAYFNEPDHLLKEVPAKYIINIFIQLPLPVTTGKCLPIVYLLNKKFTLFHIFFIN